MKEQIEPNVYLILALVLVMGALGCSEVSFSPNTDLSSESVSDELPAPHCEPGQIEIKKPTKVLFVLDQSGSNVNGPFDFPGEATDPAKSFRSHVMNSFFAQHSDKTHLSWGLLAFNGTTARSLLPNDLLDFTSSAGFAAAQARFAARADVGNTPYRAALEMVQRLIANDVKAVTADTENYLVAFLTDGYPTDYCPGGIAEVLCPGRILESEIDRDVLAIRAIALDRVKFSTIYYGRPDNTASARLQRMAQVGGGQFVDTNFNSSIDLNDILQIPGSDCE